MVFILIGSAVPQWMVFEVIFVFILLYLVLLLLAVFKKVPVKIYVAS